MMYAMIGIKPLNEEEEGEAILTCLDYKANLEVYLLYLYFT